MKMSPKSRASVALMEKKITERTKISLETTAFLSSDENKACRKNEDLT